MSKVPSHNTMNTWNTLNERGLTLLCLIQQNIPEQEQFVMFRVGAVQFGVPSRQVHAIQSLGEYEPLPFMQPCIVGVITRETQPLIVIDMRPLMDKVRTPIYKNSPIIIVQLHTTNIALLTDEIIAVPNLIPQG